MSTSTFGLGYLNDQQRFKRSSTHTTTKLRTINVRPEAKNRAVKSFDDGLLVTTRQAVTIQTRQSTILESLTKLQAQTAPTVISEQFANEQIVRQNKFLRLLPLGVASIAILSGLTVLGLSLKQNHQAAAQVAAIAQKSETGGAAPRNEAPPNEAPVSAKMVAAYSVAPDLPKSITIKKINVYARILQLGVLSSGALATPRNTNDTGWYEGSSKPGDGGTALIVGHVSGAVNVGIFYNLKKLVSGDVISVERGDGTKIDYKVVSKEEVPLDKVDMNKLLLPVTPGKAGLNLMTCGGKYQSDKETFTDRLIVYTERV